MSEPLRFEAIEIGDELPEHFPDVRLETIRRFAESSGVGRVGRFTDHEKARKEGLPGAIVPGVMSQGILAAMIHRWAPDAKLRRIDTVFRSPILADSKAVCRGVVTATHPDTRFIELDLVILNEAGETGVLGTAFVELPTDTSR
ncbi:MAG: MaoC family dehydratase [Myxococcota bacterium]